MKYRKSSDNKDIVVRLDVGDEVLDALTKLAEKEKIKCATITGIGATNDAEFGLFNSADKKYYSRNINKDTEITNLTGNITQKDSRPYLHIHTTFVDINGKVYGGHLNKAVVSVTAEIFIKIIDVDVNRKMDKDVGINVIEF